MCPHYLSLTNSSFYLEQWFSKCSPWTSSSSITWGLVRNADSGASPPDLLNQKLWALGPVTCVLTHLPHDSDTAKMWKPLVKRLEEAVWYKRKTCFELTQVGFVHIPRICLKHTYHWSHLAYLPLVSFERRTEMHKENHEPRFTHRDRGRLD